MAICITTLTPSLMVFPCSLLRPREGLWPEGAAGLAQVTLWQYIREGQDTINTCLGVKCWERGAL